MKTPIVIYLVGLVCGMLFFLVPHHRRGSVSGKRYTLAEIYRELLSDIPAWLQPRTQFFVFHGLAGVLSAFYPLLLVAIARGLGPNLSAEMRGTLIVAGGICVVGAIANVTVMVISAMTFGFGISSSSHKETVYFWIIPIFQAAFALMSIAIGVSPLCTGILYRVVTI
jgi:hypothetical protein